MVYSKLLHSCCNSGLLGWFSDIGLKTHSDASVVHESLISLAIFLLLA